MIKKIEFVALSLMVSIVLLELLVRVAPIHEKREEIFSMNLVPSVTKEEWFSKLSQEQDALKRRFQEYEIYSLQPFQGEHINVNEDGYRLTENPSAGANTTRVGFFGGSTMWGGWARDAHTIPSAFSREFAKQRSSQPIEAINYGQVGYVFSQEAHQAFRILSSKKPSEQPTPNVMVFLDGVCDSLAAMTNFMHGTKDPAGKPWEFGKYAFLFQLGKTGEVSIYDILKKSKAFRTGVRIAEKYNFKEPDEKNIYIEPTSVDLKKLARDSADSYIATLKKTHRALKGNGVRSVFILQPAFFSKNLKSEEEKALELQNQHWLGYVKETYEEIKRRSKTLASEVEFWDWSQLFQDKSETLYADVMHYNEAGNRHIGKNLSSRLLQILDPKKQTRRLGYNQF